MTFTLVCTKYVPRHDIFEIAPLTMGANNAALFVTTAQPNLHRLVDSWFAPQHPRITPRCNESQVVYSPASFSL
jgi:hypothetical protein